nr:uncharacterized protein LOC104120621 isoform X4 [Nicotiana tomentosiformis]
MSSFNNKNYKVHSKGNVPFSWENKPGVSKITPTKNCSTGGFSPKLPPPPCPVPEKAKGAAFHRLQIPPPPCAFQPPPSLLRSSSRRGFNKQDDPFLMAYKECTKSSRKASYFKIVKIGERESSSLRNKAAHNGNS